MTLTNGTFTSNTASAYGGAVTSTSNTNTMIFEQVDFTGNSGYMGIIKSVSVEPTLYSGCRWSGNTVGYSTYGAL